MPKRVIDYSNGVIYKIVCRDHNIKDCYIGFTTNFVKKKYVHKHKCNKVIPYRIDSTLLQCIRNNGGWDNWNMVEIEKFKCNDRNEGNKKVCDYAEVLNAKLY